MAHSSILIVDDNPANIKIIRVALTREGYDVRSAPDANKALAALESFRPDLVLMDIQLPGIDGLELTRRLKSDPSTREIKIIGFSAYATKADEERIIAAGCDGYILKPIDTRTLSKLIEDYLKTR